MEALSAMRAVCYPLHFHFLHSRVGSEVNSALPQNSDTGTVAENVQLCGVKSGVEERTSHTSATSPRAKVAASRQTPSTAQWECAYPPTSEVAWEVAHE